MLFKILICVCFNQVSSLSSAFIKCYPEQDTSYVIAGGVFTIYCDFQPGQKLGLLNFSDIATWKKNEDKFQNNIIQESLSNNIQRFGIHFSNVSQTDSGVYKCVYSDGKILEESDPMELVVLPKPSDPICTASPLESFVGDTATLICETYTYPSLVLFWVSDLLPNSVVFNTRNKDRTLSTVTFTPNHIDTGLEYRPTCKMNTEEGTWICTSTVVVRRRMSVKISKPYFKLNQPATIVCMIESPTWKRQYSTDPDGRSPNKVLNSKNTTLFRKYDKKNMIFEWSSTSEVLFDDAIDQANSSNKLTIQNVSDGMNGESITCTVKSNDAMGFNMITIYIEDHIVTDKSSTGDPTSSTSKGSSEEDNGNTIVNSSDSIPIEIIIPVTVLLVFLFQVPLIVLLKRYVDQNLQSGALHHTIDFDNDAYDNSMPIPQPPPTDVAFSNTVDPMIIPNKPTSQLPAVTNRQSDHVRLEETPMSLYTKANSSDPIFTEERLQLPLTNSNDFNDMLKIYPIYEEIVDKEEIL